MRLYTLVCDAAASLFQNLTVLCHQAASRRFTGTSFHTTFVLTSMHTEAGHLGMLRVTRRHFAFSRDLVCKPGFYRYRRCIGRC